ncbi:NUDIX domain-containing protein [Streptomyces albogriseolus]
MDAEAPRTHTRTAYTDADGGRWCEVYVDTYRLRSGSETVRHRIRVGGGRTGVVVVARCGVDVLLVRQWRPAIGRWAWELPRGFGETDPASDALRELAEETGLTGSTATVLTYLDVDSGLLESEVAVVEVLVRKDAPSAPAGRATARSPRRAGGVRTTSPRRSARESYGTASHSRHSGHPTRRVTSRRSRRHG